MKLRLAPRALQNRAAVSDLFEQELIATLDLIVATPTLGTEYPARFGVKVSRVFMPKTRNHV